MKRWFRRRSSKGDGSGRGGTEDYQVKEKEEKVEVRKKHE